jgi:hypothetical protein
MTRVLLLEGDAATAAATKKMLTEQNFLCDTTDLVGPRVRIWAAPAESLQTISSEAAKPCPAAMCACFKYSVFSVRHTLH